MTNNVLLMNVTNHDSVAAPTNGWPNSSGITYASFMINVSQLPNQSSQLLSENGCLCQFQNKNDAADVCHVFIDTRGTSVPGTYQLGIAGYDTSYASFSLPQNYPMDLATDVWYNVVILLNTNQDDPLYEIDGATLWVNPSLQDYTNAIEQNVGQGFVIAEDGTENTNLLNIGVSQIGFNPNVDAGISNVIAGTEFSDVLRTNPPVFGIQPQSGTSYPGNPLTLYAVASGADLTYQWHDNSGPLTDNQNITGSSSDTLNVNNLTNSDTFYCVVTDAYGTTATSASAVETIITSATPVFFPANETATTNYANEFTMTGFTNIAAGTGPINYQWFFAPASNPTAFSALRGQNSPTLALTLDSTNFQGNYYVVANTNNGSLAFGPTNTLVEPPVLSLNLPQLHALVQSYSNQIAANLTGTVYIGTNNVSVTGYVVQFNGFGSTYSEYYIEDASGLGAQVHLENSAENIDNSGPPIGTCMTVTGQLEILHNQIAIVPGDPNGVTIVPNAPTMTIGPTLANGFFNGFVTNGLGTNAFLYNSSLVTFTNVYIYGDRNGDPVANGDAFFADDVTTEYFTTGGPYNPATGNTNMLELYQFGYDYPYQVLQSEFDDATIPTNCFQLTGIYVDYNGTGRLEPSRLADYVVTAPPLAATLTDNGIPKVFWQLQVGSTYSVYSATNLTGPWTRMSSLAYFPTNVVPFTDTNGASTKFYYISSP